MLARDGRIIVGYVPLPKGEDFREYVWLSREEVKALYYTECATETILAGNFGTRQVFNWNLGEDIAQFLIVARVSPGRPVYKV